MRRGQEGLVLLPHVLRNNFDHGSPHGRPWTFAMTPSSPCLGRYMTRPSFVRTLLMRPRQPRRLALSETTWHVVLLGPGSPLLAYRPVLLRHRGLGKVQNRSHI